MRKIYFILFLTLNLFTAAALPGSSPLDERAASSGSSSGKNYVFIFQVTRYDANIADAVDFIFHHLIKPKDSLTLFTPVKSYSFSQKTRETQPQEKLIEVTKNVLKRDITIGMADHNRIVENMDQLLVDMSDPSGSGFQQGGADLKNILIHYRQLLDSVKSLRKLDEPFFLGLAETLGKLKGKNYLYILYQKELRAVPANDVLIILKEIQEIKFDVMSLFETRIDKDIMDVEKVSQAMAAAGVTVHFIYLNLDRSKGMSTELKEFSADIYDAFSKLAHATGGIVDTTSKPVKALEKAARGSQSQ
jgi:hypothetical protein